MSRFKFNDCGVCINPNIVADIKGKDYGVIITTAQVRGKWTYGMRYRLPDRGGGWGGNLSSKYWFDSEQKALTHALEWIKGWLEKQLPDKTVAKQAQKLLKAVKELLPRQRYVQLELFD